MRGITNRRRKGPLVAWLWRTYVVGLAKKRLLLPAQTPSATMTLPTTTLGTRCMIIRRRRFRRCKSGATMAINNESDDCEESKMSLLLLLVLYDIIIELLLMFLLRWQGKVCSKGRSMFLHHDVIAPATQSGKRRVRAHVVMIR